MRRGAMNFLYSLSRLNVATSRALGVLVSSQALFDPECRTPSADAHGEYVLSVLGDDAD
jgi:superfamily I DNA and/or RNA helicase